MEPARSFVPPPHTDRLTRTLEAILYKLDKIEQNLQLTPTSTWPKSKDASTYKKSRDIVCLKCQGRGHMAPECPNKRVIFVKANGEYESEDDKPKKSMEQRQVAVSVDSKEIDSEDKLQKVFAKLKESMHQRQVAVSMESKEIDSPSIKDVITEDKTAEPPSTPIIHYHITLFPDSTFSTKPNVRMNPGKDKELKIQILRLIMIASYIRPDFGPLAGLVLLASLLASTWQPCVECRALDYKHRQDVPFDPGGWDSMPMRPERLSPSEARTIQVYPRIISALLELPGEHNIFATINVTDLLSFIVGDSDLRTNPFEEGGNDEDLKACLVPESPKTRSRA